MPRNDDMVELARKVQLGNYRPAPIVLRRGRGCRVEDVEGRAYLDLTGGLAVVSVGHGHPVLAAAVAEQAARLVHVSNLFYNDRAIELAAALVERTPFDRAFFCNSGTEANEALLKLARRYHFGRGDRERVEVVACLQSFHGRTMGALTMTGQEKYHEGMHPLVPGVHHVPFGDVAAMREVVGARTAAVIVEPIQAEGGIHVGSDAYLRELRALCDSAGALLLFDEVQTGYGRTGRFLGQEWSGVVPDACSLAKGIAGGVPLGAILVKETLAAGLPPGSHASTFGGNPLACAAGLAVLRIFDDEKLVERAARVGEHLGRRLSAMVEDSSSPLAVELRGRGLLRGLRIREGVDAATVVAKARELGVLLSIVGGNVVRFSPPLVVGEDEIDEGVDVLATVLRSLS